MFFCNPVNLFKKLGSKKMCNIEIIMKENIEYFPNDQNETFNYTDWQKDLYDGKTVDKIGQDAMQYWNKTHESMQNN
jgi:hypothetical protein